MSTSSKQQNHNNLIGSPLGYIIGEMRICIFKCRTRAGSIRISSPSAKHCLFLAGFLLVIDNMKFYHTILASNTHGLVLSYDRCFRDRGNHLDS